MKPLRHFLAVLAALACIQAGAQASAAATGPAPGTGIAAAPQASAAASNAAVFRACAAAAPGGAPCPLDAVFGLFKLAPNNDVLDFKPSGIVPRVPGQGYGWILKLNRKAGKVRVLERMTLPQAPRTWGAGGAPHGLSADRKTISLDVTLTVYDGKVSKSWDVARGDPPGHYVISAFVEGAAAVQFEFDVVEAR